MLCEGWLGTLLNELVGDVKTVVGNVCRSGTAGNGLNLTIPLHDRIKLVRAGYGKRLSVIVTTRSTTITCYSPLGITELVTHDLVLGLTIDNIAGWEEIHKLVGVVQYATGVSHVVFTQFHAARAGVRPAGPRRGPGLFEAGPGPGLYRHHVRRLHAAL